MFFIAAHRAWFAPQQAEHVRVSCSALQNMSEAVWMGGPCGSLTYVNTAFTRLTGFTSGEVLGRSWELLQVGNNTPTPPPMLPYSTGAQCVVGDRG